METTDKAAILWFGGIGTMLAADVAVHLMYPDMEVTFSHQCRNRLHVEHPVGEAFLYLGWGALTVWFLPHIVRPARHKRRLLSLPL